jgi:hypothetical protein
MVTALAAAKSSTERATMQRSWPSAKAAQYASIMTMKRSRNWSVPLRKLLVSSQTAEILDLSDDVCTHFMPRKS